MEEDGRTMSRVRINYLEDEVEIRMKILRDYLGWLRKILWKDHLVR